MTISESIHNMIATVLQASTWTSAGGKNPVDNFIKNLRGGGPEAFEELIRQEIDRVLDERQDTETKSIIEEDAGTDSIISESGVAGGVRQGIGLAKNPMGILTKLMAVMPHTALIALAISLIPMMIDLLKAPGMPMDIRFKRIMEDEENAFLDRQTQRNTQIGLRQVIIQSEAGFIMANGAQSEDTLRQIREGDQSVRKANIDFTDHARSLF